MEGLLTLAALSASGAFFFMGLLYERVRWNNLIHAGIIPKPDGKS
jgi:hypothetical protein